MDGPFRTPESKHEKGGGKEERKRILMFQLAFSEVVCSSLLRKQLGIELR